MLASGMQIESKQSASVAVFCVIHASIKWAYLACKLIAKLRGKTKCFCCGFYVIHASVIWTYLACKLIAIQQSASVVVPQKRVQECILMRKAQVYKDIHSLNKLG